MMMALLKDDDELLLNAYFDGELDPASAREFERRLASDESLKARYDRLQKLREGVSSIPQVDMPAGLQASVQSRLDAERPNNVPVLRRRTWSYQALAAAAVLGAVISSSVMMTMEQFGQRDNVTSEVVAGHIRGLLAPQPYDIASSDRHTVKPWFTARLPASPQVPDLAAQGFSLLGGRVDVIGHDPVATIVYKHAAHTISLTTLRSGQSIPDQTVSGYNVRSWSDPYFTYVAVSDLAGADLAAFERAFSKASPASEIK
ncbi:MAG TPA: anti-sigma factor [Bradyrhizobium sp.]|jgi:anti-sigma factor RsiW|uniref:anti-sigma factor family protein n=1 Tax=Bradyrhizobium sp. TaxID=376 RepID=UPI002CCCA032|nr:anti-sigma factor [Bradyrhizobium sp.]HXB78077.1 anti-sigma factor [Bradyrhizobium sp.]